jgi:predicted ATPase with chaperone activity
MLIADAKYFFTPLKKPKPGKRVLEIAAAGGHSVLTVFC